MFFPRALLAHPRPRKTRPQRSTRARQGRSCEARIEKSWIASPSRLLEARRRVQNLGVQSPSRRRDTPMEISSLDIIEAGVGPVAEMDRLGNEIAELSAHIEA